MHKANRAIFSGLCFWLLATTTQNATATELVLDCRGGQGETTSVKGDFGETRVKKSQEGIENVMVTITQDKCLVDWGTQVGSFSLRASSQDKIICAHERIKTDPKHTKKDEVYWKFTINRLTGKMQFVFMSDYRSNDDWISKEETTRDWQCKKAQKLF